MSALTNVHSKTSNLLDEYDMCVISEYEKEKEAGTLELFSLDDVVKEIEG